MMPPLPKQEGTADSEMNIEELTGALTYFAGMV